MSTGMTTFTGAYTIACEICDERESIEFDRPSDNVARAFKNAMTRRGWTFYVSRSLRTYCPTCEPSKGHKMSNVTPVVDQ